ncbi:MAG: response regulator transcription factor [Bacteroidia bacterium]|nr:response regulator transcription factor [Bacteroidia bacterium]
MKTILIDDEPLAIAEMRYMLQAFSHIEVIAEAHHFDEAKSAIETHKPDLIFLDINMPGKNGFELLEDVKFTPIVIFATANDQFAIKAFELNALDYLLKPINENRLAQAINKVTDEWQMQLDLKVKPLESKVFIKDGEQCYFVKLTDIFLIESIGNYAKIYFDKKAPLLHKSLNQLEERLPKTTFFRANRSQLINVNYIENISPYFKGGLQVTLKNGSQIEVSNRQAVKFKDMMSL